MNGNIFVLRKKLVPVNFDPAFQDYIKHFFYGAHNSYQLYFFLVFRDKISLCSSFCPGTRSLGQAGLELGDPLSLPPPSDGINTSAITPDFQLHTLTSSAGWDLE